MEKQTIEEYIAKWEKSGLSKSEYCKKHNLKYSTFMYWSLKDRNSKRNTWKPVRIMDEEFLKEEENILELHINKPWKISLRIQF